MHPKKIEEIIKNGLKTKADVNYFFSEIRCLLEVIDPKKNKYKIIWFYCDWIVHHKKDNLKEMYDYFKELEKIFNEGEVWVNDKVNKHIERLTSFIFLAEKLEQLLKSIKADYQFLYNEWIDFSNILRQLIINRPINFDRLKTNPKYRKIKLFVVSDFAPIMIDLDNALYWMIFINTSDFPLCGVIPESIGLFK